VTALAATEEATATVSSDGMLRVWSSAKGVLQWEAVVHARGSAAPTSVEFFAPGMVCRAAGPLLLLLLLLMLLLLLFLFCCYCCSCCRCCCSRW
jgi:hypothetical protein